MVSNIDMNSSTKNDSLLFECSLNKTQVNLINFVYITSSERVLMERIIFGSKYHK